MAALPSAEDLDLDLSAATPDVTIDQDIGWIGDETALTPTQEAGPLYGSGGDTVEQLDLRDPVPEGDERPADLPDPEGSAQPPRKRLRGRAHREPGGRQERSSTNSSTTRDEDTMIRTGTDQIPPPLSAA